MILKNLAFGSKYFDVAMVCAVDICRAASRVAPQEGGGDAEVPLISMAYDIAHELKVCGLELITHVRRSLYALLDR